jgi:nitroreductase
MQGDWEHRQDHPSLAGSLVPPTGRTPGRTGLCSLGRMNQTYRTILALRANRSFSSDPIAADDLASVLEAARWTGSSKNTQNWSFVVVDDPSQKNTLCSAGDFTTPIQNAPAAICLVENPGGYEFDTGRLAQNIMLAADALGLATCPITLHRSDLAAQILDLPDGYRCRYAVAIGYPGSTPGAAFPSGGRKPLAELVHRNTFGGA